MIIDVMAVYFSKVLVLIGQVNDLMCVWFACFILCGFFYSLFFQ